MANLSELLKYLLKHELDFVLIGGFAGVVHGSTLVTKDLDICALLAPKDIQNLRTILAPIHPKHRMTPAKLSFLTEPDDISAVKNLYLETDLGVLDVITVVKGVGDYGDIEKRATRVPLFGFQCKVISVEDLIAAKKSLGRDKDLIAVRELEQIRRKK